MAARRDDPPFLSRAALRAVDAAAQGRFGLPTICLMENASSALLGHALAMLAPGARPVAILCGPGNNGGDGFALARRLHNAGVEPVVALLAAPERSRGDAGVNLGVIRAMGLAIGTVDGADPGGSLDALLARGAGAGPGAAPLFVDAILGTGADRPLEPTVAAAVRWINARREAGALVLAVDIPTGLDCDTGLPLPGIGGGPGDAVRAHRTVALGASKLGYLDPRSRAWTGEVFVGDIGAPRELLREPAARGG